MEKLQKIQSELKAPKNQFNKFGGYKYRSLEDIVEAFKPLGEKYKCALTLTDRVEFIGNRFYVVATATLIDVENGTTLSVEGWAREPETRKGMDEAQVTGSTSSYARKYAANALLAIDDTKDSDATNTHEQTSARNGQTRQGAGTPPLAPANKLDDVLPPEPPEVSKENQAILDGLNEFFSTSNLTGIKKLMALERKDKAAKVDLIKWYCYFAGDATQPGAIEVLKKASEYKSSSIETFEALAKASDGRVGATYKEAKKALYNHLRKLKGFEDEPGK